MTPASVQHLFLFFYICVLGPTITIIQCCMFHLESVTSSLSKHFQPFGGFNLLLVSPGSGQGNRNLVSPWALTGE